MPTVSPHYGKTDPSDLPGQRVQMRLKCEACGSVGKYNVGQVIVDPGYFADVQHEDPIKSLRRFSKVRWVKWVSFTGYFVCANCGSGGPWGFTSEANEQVMLMMLAASAQPSESQVFVGGVTMFDGTSPRTAYEGVAHLQRLLEKEPTNAFLWNRLGNLFVGADEMELARPAFEKAVELNPRDVESLHSLGAYCFDSGELDAAERYLNAVIQHSRGGTWHNVRMKEMVVRDALEVLIQIHLRTRGKIELQLPKGDVEHLDRNDESRNIRRLDLLRDTDIGQLVHFVLHGRVPDVRTAHRQWDPPRVAARSEGARVGRNDPCPCKSGKKFKHCCYRR